MPSAPRSLVPESDYWPAPGWHLDRIADELTCDAPKERMLAVVARMTAQRVPDLSSIDWARELAAFPGPDDAAAYPAYYRQPFHSVPGGYLSEHAAMGDRRAMEAIYEESHPRRSLGIRDALATLVPHAARDVVDLGGGTGDGAAAIARRLPAARVLSLDASPFMTIAARQQNADLPNVRFERGLAEATRLPDAGFDAVAITLVLHECPDPIKRAILAEARRILRPGGTLALSDTATDDLHTYRGFHEPYEEQWRVFEPDTFLAEAGFEEIETHEAAPPLWSRVARRPD